MKYFQTIRMQMLRAIFQRPVIKRGSYCCIFIFLISCQPLKIDTDISYDIINVVLDTSVVKDSVYLYPRIVILNDTKIGEFKTYGIDIDSCNTKINDIVLSGGQSILTKINREEKWNYAKIKHPKVISHLQLKLPESIARYKKLSETVKDEYDLLDRKFMLWTLEHHEGMIQLSYPFFNKTRSHALVYVSKYNDGEFVLTMKRNTRKNWSIICKKRLSYY